jgi:hypothetical protein
MMPIEEKLDILVKSIELDNAGKHEEAERLHKTAPLAPFIAKWAKEHMGVEYLLNSGWNLSDAEVQYGKDWLTK